MNSRSTESSLWRLYRDRRAVGFSKNWGATTMFSKTLAAYSGTPIAHTLAVRALPLRTLEGQPIFHGDVVARRSSPEQTYLVLGSLERDDAVLCARPSSSRLLAADVVFGNDRRQFVRRGSVVETVYFSRLFDAALRRYALQGASLQKLGWSLSLVIFVGCVLAGVIQWQVGGGVGPLSSLLGGVLGAWLFFLIWKSRSPRSFSRARTSRVAECSVWPLAALFGVSYLLAAWLQLPGMDLSLGAAVVGGVALAILGALLSLVAGAIAADTLTRRVDHRDRAVSELRSFLESGGDYLRQNADDAMGTEEDEQSG